MTFSISVIVHLMIRKKLRLNHDASNKCHSIKKIRLDNDSYQERHRVSYFRLNNDTVMKAT